MEFFRIKHDIPFMRHALVFNIISLVTFLLAVISLSTKGLHFGVDFTGGTVMEVHYAKDVPDLDKIREEVARMARENAAWLARRGLAARTVTLKVRYAGFVTVTRSHTLSRHTADAEVISSWAVELLSRTEAGTRPVRLLGVRVQGLVEQSAS